MAIGVEHRQMFSDLALDFQKLFEPHFVPRLIDLSDRLMAGEVIQTKDIFSAFHAGIDDLAPCVESVYDSCEKSCARIKASFAIQDDLQASREREREAAKARTRATNSKADGSHCDDSAGGPEQESGCLHQA